MRSYKGKLVGTFICFGKNDEINLYLTLESSATLQHYQISIGSFVTLFQAFLSLNPTTKYQQEDGIDMVTSLSCKVL